MLYRKIVCRKEIKYSKSVDHIEKFYFNLYKFLITGYDSNICFFVYLSILENAMAIEDDKKPAQPP